MYFSGILAILGPSKNQPKFTNPPQKPRDDEIAKEFYENFL